MTSRVLAAAGVALATLALCGCAAFGPARTQSCVSWVDFEDAQAMYDEATLVVAGVADPADGSIELLSGPGERHRILVEKVYKGDFAGEELWAAAPRDYCVADPPQPAVDPIPTGERVILFLHPAMAEPLAAGEEPDPHGVESWATMTPLDGVLGFPDGADVPFDPSGD